jgi:hypothetical protein
LGDVGPLVRLGDAGPWRGQMTLQNVGAVG